MPHATNASADATAPSTGLITLYAVAAGAVVANLYYAQPLVGLIAPALHLPKSIASLLVTFTQLGYACGLLLLVPLGDLVENRALSTRLIGGSVIALTLATAAWAWPVFLAAALLIGLCSSAVQILVPMIATLTPDATRGRVVGNVMGGLVFGILLARPVASLIAYAVGWRAVFGLSALGMAALFLVLRRHLPRVAPKAEAGYFSLILSMFKLYATEPTLRRRAAYQCAAFGVFSLYWTAVPIYLTEQFHYTQFGIAVFALVGAAGAISAPLAGRLADAGHGRVSSAVSLALVLVSFGVSALAAALHSVVLLALAGVALDFGVQANNVLGQRAIYALAPELRARLNGAYMAAFFVGGATGSAVASALLIHGGWPLVALVGAAAPALALSYFILNEIRRRRAAFA
ncbi:MFS transporter [Acidiphilium sp. PA]|uniref:MFS transporter n=1 Tax=Acidiphilium sp. PA TaxID=2871705 RepID=UPI00224321C6|nr:MFS transporter [Acidiphilium sp. PA]MCW8306300.1 MFS transporter [Acidiphilium sp. PA]